MHDSVRVRFYGVRGSTPCAGPEYSRYGGHSSCVAIEADNAPPILFDLGTGLRPYGVDYDGLFNGSVLLTHLHWDHVQGLPFFTPLHREGASLDVYGPRQVEGALGDVFSGMMCPPYFPIQPNQLAGDVRFHDTGDDDFPVGTAKVRSRWVRHVGPTLGFRIDWNGVSIAYVPDHGPGCNPDDPDDYVPHEMLELCDGVDLLIHDAQHTHEEYGPKRHWATARSSTRSTSPKRAARATSRSSTTIRRTATSSSRRSKRKPRTTPRPATRPTCSRPSKVSQSTSLRIHRPTRTRH
jgi:phosphoribosyl 1,2-cyclic phosphodiesterase